VTERPKATTKTCFSRLPCTASSEETQWVYSGTHTHTCLLTYWIALDPPEMSERGHPEGECRTLAVRACRTPIPTYLGSIVSATTLKRFTRSRANERAQRGTADGRLWWRIGRANCIRGTTRDRYTPPATVMFSFSRQFYTVISSSSVWLSKV